MNNQLPRERNHRFCPGSYHLIVLFAVALAISCTGSEPAPPEEEAAGVEPSRRDSGNRLMAHGFRSLWPNSLPLLAVFRFIRVYSSPFHSTPVMETCWRQFSDNRKEINHAVWQVNRCEQVAKDVKD